ncbi:MAG: hypothetical protein KGI33_06285 [Thaumarchaeota archaeon]|nr:hypothetical protein [Nitrososphaerota archaeon]
MVFGFGRKKTAEEPRPKIPQEMEITIQEIPSVIRGVEAPRVSDLIKKARDLKGEIELNQKNIYNIVMQLESDDLKLDDVDKNLKAIGVRGKEAVVSTIKKETKSTLVTVEKYEDVIELSDEVNQMLKRMGDVLGLHTRVMHVFARKYADRLKDEIADLAKNRNSLQHSITEQERFKSDSMEILAKIQKINYLKKENEAKVHRINEIISERAQATNTIAALEGEISDTMSSPEYSHFQEEKNKMVLLDTEKSQIKGKINLQFSKISRPLNKYSYVSAFDKSMKKIMEDLMKDPYQVLSEENKGAIIEILEAVTKSVVAGNVSVKDSDRSTEAVEETIQKLDEFLKLKADHQAKVMEIEHRLKSFDSKKLEDAKKSLEKARVNLASLEAAHKKLEGEMDENKNQFNLARTDLERRLESLLDNPSVKVQC